MTGYSAEWHALARELYHEARMGASDWASWPAWEHATLAAKLVYQRRARKMIEQRDSERRNADRVDGYDRDDLGLSPDY